MEQKRHLRGIVGEVVSTKMEKTIIVSVQRLIQDPRYLKQVKKTMRFHVHNPSEKCKIGDKVLICETKPISKTKAWILDRVISRAKDPLDLG